MAGGGAGAGGGGDSGDGAAPTEPTSHGGAPDDSDADVDEPPSQAGEDLSRLHLESGPAAPEPPSQPLQPPPGGGSVGAAAAALVLDAFMEGAADPRAADFGRWFSCPAAHWHLPLPRVRGDLLLERP